MSNASNFDEASAAAMEMMTQEQELSPDEMYDVGNDVSDNSNEMINEQVQNPPNNTSELGQAVQTAEIAAQVASEKDGQLQQALQDIENLKRQNQQLQGTIEELSQKNSENIIDEVLSPPVLDINGLAFADEETQNAAVAKFAEEMSAYNRQELMREMSPALEFAKKSMRDEERKEVVAALSQIPELANIKEIMPQINRIIENNKWLQSEDMPMDEKYINAYAMARGIESINNPPQQPAPQKEPTTEELLELYNNNPTFQELVEKQRIDRLNQSRQVPTFSASNGAAGAALNIREKPKTLDEASELTRKMFGGI